MKKRGFTLIELLVVIAIIAMLLAILMPALSKVKAMAHRVVCGANLRGLGNAHVVYANDYNDLFVRQGGRAAVQWFPDTPGWQNPAKKWNVDSVQTTVGASLYLLVREADVSPASFVCKASSEVSYDGQTSNPAHPDIVELWDFGNETMENCGRGPRGHVSYSYHMPYSRFAMDGSRSSSFAVMADKNPWFDGEKLEETAPVADSVSGADFSGKVHRLYEYFVSESEYSEKWHRMVANSQPHGRIGQNVLYGDGHNEFVKVSDVGERHDNIYTIQHPAATDESGVRCGIGSAGFYKIPRASAMDSEIQPKNRYDSVLVNDDD